MKFRFLSIALTSVILSSNGFGQNPSPEPSTAKSSLLYPGSPLSNQDFGKIISNYYLNPTPEQVPALIDFMQKNHLPSASNRGALLGFFLVLFHNNPLSRTQWDADGAKTSGSTLELFKTVHSRADHIDNLPELTIDTEEPGNNDFCWGAFYASGDEHYLDVLVQRLGLIKDQKSRMKFAVGASSEWSLASNALSHTKVRDFLTKKMAENLPDDIHGGVQASLTKTPNQLEREMILGLRRFNQGEKTAK